jgi:hypothetical protein
VYLILTEQAALLGAAAFAASLSPAITAVAADQKS